MYKVVRKDKTVKVEDSTTTNIIYEADESTYLVLNKKPVPVHKVSDEQLLQTLIDAGRI